MIISQLSIAPVGIGTSLSKYVNLVINCLKTHNIKFVTNDMATVIETSDLETLFNVISKAHQAVIDAGAKRVITELKIDDRRDKNVIIGSKINSLN
ncbi:hypothetical protein AYK24_01820 [Thermoplasmatales archaeon SG8-52-4]|nr:MAG: hypothetical protein AYK24_01820 [Thermoplasmatales archaeon SG8-52-4]